MAQYSNLFVVCMGMGVVFFGLICIIFLTMLMGVIMNLNTPKSRAVISTEAADNKDAASGAVRPQVIAAITAAIREETGQEPQGMKIVSIRKV